MIDIKIQLTSDTSSILSEKTVELEDSQISELLTHLLFELNWFVLEKKSERLEKENHDVPISE